MENKETLKEVAKEIFKEEYICNGIDIAPAWREGFVTGAKWQAERMYSEEEVRQISLDFFYHWWNSKGTNTEQGFDKWFEQFKQKEI
jgi:hypothetical protein